MKYTLFKKNLLVFLFCNIVDCMRSQHRKLYAGGWFQSVLFTDQNFDRSVMFTFVHPSSVPSNVLHALKYGCSDHRCSIR